MVETEAWMKSCIKSNPEKIPETGEYVWGALMLADEAKKKGVSSDYPYLPYFIHLCIYQTPQKCFIDRLINYLCTRA
jgi:hypothetical protein